MFDDTSQKAQNVTVEVILVRSLDNEIEIKTDETAKPMIIPRSGIKMVTPRSRKKADKPAEGTLVKLTMTERRAVTVGLA